MFYALVAISSCIKLIAVDHGYLLRVLASIFQYISALDVNLAVAY